MTVMCRLAAHNTTLTSLSLTNCSTGRDFTAQFMDALAGNEHSQLFDLDFSGTFMDDRGSQALNRLAAKFTKGDGFSRLRLGECSLARKLTASFIVNLKGSMGSLVELDLSKNVLTLDSELALREYLAGPNQLQSLKLSDCHIERLETLIGALSLGCLRSLQSLWLDGNSFVHTDGGSSRQQSQQQHVSSG